jgi:hypothetical protein
MTGLEPIVVVLLEVSITPVRVYFAKPTPIGVRE